MNQKKKRKTAPYTTPCSQSSIKKSDLKQTITCPSKEKKSLSEVGFGKAVIHEIEKSFIETPLKKETYNLLDRNGEELTLKPEGTASCIRAILEHGLIKYIQNNLSSSLFGVSFFFDCCMPIDIILNFISLNFLSFV